VATDTIRIGVPTVGMGLVDRTVSLPSLAAVTVDVAAIDLEYADIFDVVRPLDSSVTYQVYVAAFGYDVATSGYTFDICSAASPGVAATITAGQGLHVHIDNADFPANFIYSCGVAVFLKAGSADPVLCQIDILDPAKDFDTVIVTDPHPAALSFTAAVLTAATTTSTTGSRDPRGMSIRTLGPTINGVGLTYNVEGPSVNLDSGPAYSVPVVRQPTVDFQVAENSARNFILANGGVSAQIDLSGTIIDIHRQSLSSAMALLGGNVTLKLVMPPDDQNISETKMIYSMVKGNIATTSQRWSKNDVPTVNFNIPSAIQDKLLRNIHCEVTRRYEA
jgi:hypothetical protein